MKALCILLTVFTVIQARASKPDSDTIKSLVESQSACDNFVKFDDNNIYLGFGPYKISLNDPRQPIPGKFRVVPFDGSPAYDLNTNDSTLDAITVGPSTYVLTYSAIEEWNVAKQQRIGIYPTFDAGGPMMYKQHAMAMALWNNQLIIAHGRLGVSIFDLQKKHIVKQIPLVQELLPLESMAMGVTVQGNTAYVVMDNFTLGEYQGQQPFRGVITIDLPSQQVTRQLDGLDPGADKIIADNKTLVISFGGNPIWRYDLSSFAGSKLPTATDLIWKMPVKGWPMALPFMDDKYYYTCYAKKPATGSTYINVPMALDRATMHLK